MANSSVKKNRTNQMKNFDLIGEQVNLKHNGDNTYKTSCGGFYSIIYILLGVLALCIYVTTYV